MVSKTDSRRGKRGKTERNSSENSSQGSGERISGRKRNQSPGPPQGSGTPSPPSSTFFSLPYWEFWAFPCPAAPGGSEPQSRTSPTEEQSQGGFQKYPSQALEKILSRLLTRNDNACKFMSLALFLRRTGKSHYHLAKCHFLGVIILENYY